MNLRESQIMNCNNDNLQYLILAAKDGKWWESMYHRPSERKVKMAEVKDQVK